MKVVTEGLGDKVAVVTLEIDGVKLRMSSQPLSKEEAAKVSAAGADVEVISTSRQQAVGRVVRSASHAQALGTLDPNIVAMGAGFKYDAGKGGGK